MSKDIENTIKIVKTMNDMNHYELMAILEKMMIHDIEFVAPFFNLSSENDTDRRQMYISIMRSNEYGMGIIGAIKKYRDNTGASLKDAKDYIYSLKVEAGMV